MNITDGDTLLLFEDIENLRSITTKKDTDGMYTSDGEAADTIGDVELVEGAPDTCEECGAANAIYTEKEGGFVTCRFCRTVFERNIPDFAPEWRQGGGEDGGPEVTGRCGGPSNFYFPTSSIGTSISGNSKLKRYNNWQAMSGSERSMYRIFTNIQNRCVQGKLKKCVADDAKDFWNQIKKCKPNKRGRKKGKTNINRGVTQTALIAACVHFACSNRRAPVSHQWSANLFKIENEDMTAGCRLFLDKAEQCGLLSKLNTNVPVEYIQLARSTMSLGKDTFDLAIKIADNATLLNLATEHMPNSTAAGCILMACVMNRISITKHTVALAFTISDVTITKAYKKLILFRKILYSRQLTLDAAKIINEERERMLDPYRNRKLIDDTAENKKIKEREKKEARKKKKDEEESGKSSDDSNSSSDEERDL